MTKPKLTVRTITARRLGLLAVAMAMALIGAAAGGSGKADAEEEATMAARGRVTYRIYCSNCHGKSAEGDGHLGPMLHVRPADLTRLRDDDGLFPADRVRRAIDGRVEVAGHGLQEMPVWGDVFADDASADERAQADAKIADLVAFLKTLQRQEG